MNNKQSLILFSVLAFCHFYITFDFMIQEKTFGILSTLLFSISVVLISWILSQGNIPAGNYFGFGVINDNKR
jgi:hypothetical protein